jgi:protein pelota
MGSTRRPWLQVGTREDQTERIRMTVTIKVVNVDYDGEAECRCKGTCCSENPHIPLGAFHTIVLEPGNQLTLSKACWDVLDIKRLEEAAEPASNSDLAVVLITEGIAHVCLIGKSSTSLRSKVVLSPSMQS